jgi:hypothetical protein
MRFQGGRLKGFGQAFKAGLMGRGGGGVAHGGVFSKKKTAPQQMPCRTVKVPIR